MVARGSMARLGGAAVAAAVVVLMLGTLVLVARHSGSLKPGPADLAALRFTVVQALVSALLSVGLAVPVARALARRRFAGRALLVAALGAPFLLPTVVAVLGLLAVFGRGGWLNAGLGALGVPAIGIYGFHGVVLAHVFFNLPLAVRMILQGWQAIPAERFRLAASLGFSPREIFRHLEAPMLRAVLPGAALAVFVICLTSFAVALTLGGGPRATTVELAIYQAVRFDFDLGRAAILSLIQFALCAGAVLLAARVTVPTGFGAGLGRAIDRHDVGGTGLRLLDALVLSAAAGFLLLPLGAVVWRGLWGLPALPAAVWSAAGISVLVALVSAAMTLGAGLSIALASERGLRWVETAGMLPLAASSLVLGTGLFLAVFPFVSPGRVALPVTALVNATLALPFVLRILLPALREVEATQGRLADSLGLAGASRLRHVILPGMRAPLGFAGGLAAALSMGDLGVIALFALEGHATLPLQVYRLMGAYRSEAAEAAALLLVGLSFGLFWIFDRGGRVNART